MLGCMDRPSGYMLSSAEPIVQRATVPTMIAGRYGTLDEGDEAIRTGLADMVSYVRAMIADEDLVAKSARGEALRVRPCIACNQGCVGGIRTPVQRMTCTVNPAVGLRADAWRASDHARRDAAEGGGGRRRSGRDGGGADGGACTAIEVVLMEAQPNLGGALNLAKHAPKLAAIHDIAIWLEEEVFRLGVDVRLSTFAEEAEVLAEEPDVVIVATGSLPRADGFQAMRPEAPIPGFHQPHVLSSWDLMLDTHGDHGKTAVVFDDVGHYEGIACAETLIAQGVAVTFVARHSSFAPTMDIILRTAPALRRLREGDFTLVVSGRIVEIGQGTCTLAWLDGGKPWEVPADTVVFVSYNQAQADLWRALGGGTRAPKPYQLHLIGDANAPRDLLMAIREGNLAGRIKEKVHA